MSKKVAFVALALLAVTFAVVGRRLQANFLSDLWSQLFWLSVGTLTTTFVLEAILQRGVKRRQRARDAFAFRSFSANMMIALQEMIGLKQTNDKLFEAALSGDKQFEVATAEVASSIEESEGFEANAYVKYYLDIGSGLRTLSAQYIRLFSANQKDMLLQYQELNALANLWQYKDEFSAGSRQYAASLNADNPDKALRDTALAAQVSSARALVVNTSKVVAKLAAKAATGKSFYD
jgi:hypothetical protein